MELTLPTTSNEAFYSKNKGRGIQARVAPWQAVALCGPVEHLGMYGGVATGKTFTLAHFSIKHFLKYPHLTGFIGANTYDQLNQATMRELLKWLDRYHIEYVVNERPPVFWGGRRQFPTYKNTISVRHPKLGTPATAFTRVLSDPDALRGIEFSWYALDETRDTPKDTHEVILSRMRESAYRKGLVTTTTFGKDWSWKRFVEGGDGKRYGSMHIPTEASLQLGIINQQYYDTLLASYSPLFALQELWAKHVNVLGGRAYYAGSDANRMRRAPWGEEYPNVERPLIIGCDFNFSPKPCIWMIGQLGPELYHPRTGVNFGDSIHWFGEICRAEASTPEMTSALLAQWPGFFYRVFGDASGGIGTTSNAGEHDFHQMGQVFEEAEAEFTIDYDQQNPLVRDRVENMNAKMMNALGQVHMTWDPARCPQFDGDVENVGWKPTVQKGRGKLDDGGDGQRTHATDGGGYAVFKLLPPYRRASFIPGVPSAPLVELFGAPEEEEQE